MTSSDCEPFEQKAEEFAKEGKNWESLNQFEKAAECWRRWESFKKAACAFERAYEHAMLVFQYSKAAEFLIEAGYSWIKQGEFEKFELDCQIAAEAYLLAAEEEKNPVRFVDGSFCSILGGDLDLGKELIDAALKTTDGEPRELAIIASLLSEYQFGEAYEGIEEISQNAQDKDRIRRVRHYFILLFGSFVRTTLESEAAASISSLSKSTGIDAKRIKSFVRRGISEGLIPAYLDDETEELIVDTDRVDIETLTLRKGPILSRDLEDPGAWDIDLDE
jgi:tetratricopeptide (TPR) repeat protein